MAKEIGEQYSVPYYTDAEEMMEKHNDIDVVDICTGDYTHHSLAKMAAEHKMHPIVEKPMSITLPCCDVMIEACRKNGVYFEVAENYFRMPQDRVIIKLVAKGVIGDVMRVYYIDPIKERPLWKVGSHSGVCLDMGVYRMSQIRLYAQSEPKKIAGITKQFVPADGKVYEDWGHAIVCDPCVSFDGKCILFAGKRTNKYWHSWAGGFDSEIRWKWYLDWLRKKLCRVGYEVMFNCFGEIKMDFLGECLPTTIGSLPHTDVKRAVELILEYTPVDTKKV